MTSNVNNRRTGLMFAFGVLVLAVVIALFASVGRADAVPGSSAADPVVVANPSDVPAGAVEDAQSTYATASECDTTRSWVHTVPGTNAVTHKEWTAEQSSRTKSQQPVYKTQYRFAKYTRIKTRTYTPGTPAIKAQHYSLAGGAWKTNATPAFPNPGDPYKWVANTGFEPHGGEATYPSGTTGQHYTGAPGNTNWFYFQPAKAAVPGTYGSWSAYGDWSKWTPESHTSWQDSNTPLGVPEYHASGTYSNGTQWYREWQARATGETRQVQTGTQTVYSEWSAWTPYGTNPYRTEPVLPANTDLKQYRKNGPVVVTDQAGTPAVVTYYAWSDGKVCETTTSTPTPEPPVVTPPVALPPVVTPPTPELKVKPRVDVSTRCTGTTKYVADNRRSEAPVKFTLKGGKWTNKITVPAGKKVTVVKRLPNGVRAVIKTVGDMDSVRVPNPCPTPPKSTPSTGFRKAA